MSIYHFLKIKKNIARILMYWTCRVPVILNSNDNGTAFTRTVVTSSIFILLRCMAHQFEAKDLSKLALLITQIMPITVWCSFCMNQSYIYSAFITKSLIPSLVTCNNVFPITKWDRSFST